MTKIVLTPSDLSAEHFTVGTDTDGGKIIEIKATPVTLLPIKSYVATPNTNVVTMNTGNTEQRMRLQTQGNFGIFHIDFIARTTSALGATSAFTLPNDAPTPLSLIETQVRSGGTIWLAANGRGVKYDGLQAGQRYIVDLIGFWG